MYDINLRPLKDRLFNPLCSYIPQNLTPLHITLLSFISGIISCALASSSYISPSLLFWFANRSLDCLDGALARHRNVASDAGGFLDLLADFIVYSGIPIAVAAGSGIDTTSKWIAVSLLEATFHVNNFVLFYVGAVLEKQKAVEARANGKESVRSKQDAQTKVKELTSVTMRPALIEGFESGVIFTLMLACPAWITEIAWGMAALVCVGIVQRVVWVLPVL